MARAFATQKGARGARRDEEGKEGRMAISRPKCCRMTTRPEQSGRLAWLHGHKGNGEGKISPGNLRTGRLTKGLTEPASGRGRSRNSLQPAKRKERGDQSENYHRREADVTTARVPERD